LIADNAGGITFHERFGFVACRKKVNEVGYINLITPMTDLVFMQLLFFEIT